MFGTFLRDPHHGADTLASEIHPTKGLAPGSNSRNVLQSPAQDSFRAGLGFPTDNRKYASRLKDQEPERNYPLSTGLEILSESCSKGQRTYSR